MCDLQLMYRECGAETRDDYLRGIANENGLPIACVRKIADRLGEREDFGAMMMGIFTSPLSLCLFLAVVMILITNSPWWTRWRARKAAE